VAASEDGERLVVFTPYLGEDLDRFEAAIDEFEDRSDVDVTVIGSGSFEADLVSRVAGGAPPDVAMIPQPGLLRELVDGGAVLPLGEAAREAASDVAPELRELVTSDGDEYGAWYRLTNKSLVWYRPSVFEERGEEPPATWAELEDLTARAVDDGLPPWCLSVADFGATGWVGTDWIEQHLVLAEGTDVYEDWASGEVAFTDDRVADAFEAFGAIALDPRQVVGGTRRVLSTSVARGAEPLRDDPPGCLLFRQGDGLPGAPTSTDGVEGELRSFPMPVVDEDVGAPVVIAGDAAAALTEREGVAELMAFLASADGGRPWMEDGGLLTPHADVPLDEYEDARDRAAVEQVRAAFDGDGVVFDASDLMPAEIGTDAFWTGVVDYLRGEPLADVLERIEAARP
jgi:alpha-glucoside transport system substrate-binding protein